MPDMLAALWVYEYATGIDQTIRQQDQRHDCIPFNLLNLSLVFFMYFYVDYWLGKKVQ